MAITWKKLAYVDDVVLNSLATAQNDFLVGGPSPFGSFVKKTLSETKSILSINTGDSPSFTTIKCSALTDGYVPKHTSDATGLENSPIYTDGTNVGISTTAPGTRLELYGDSFLHSAIRFTNTANFNTETWDVGCRATASGINYFSIENSVDDGVFAIRDAKIGIGTSNPSTTLSFGGNIARAIGMERESIANTAGNSLTIQAGGATLSATDKSGGNLILISGVSTGTGGSEIQFWTAPTATTGTTDNAALLKMTLTSAGNLVMGSSQILTQCIQAPTLRLTPSLQNTTTNGSIASIRFGDITSGPGYYCGKSRGSDGSPLILHDGDHLGCLSFQGDDSVQLVEGAYIQARVNGTPDVNIIPTDILFATMDTTGSKLIRAAIKSNGYVGLGTTNPGANLEVSNTLSGTTGAFVDWPKVRVNQSSNNTYSIGDVHGSYEFYASTDTPGLLGYIASVSTRGTVAFADSGLWFGTSNSAVAADYTNPQMVINHNGYVGIGTSTPTIGLEVATARIRVSSATTNAAVLQFMQYDQPVDQKLWEVYSSGTGGDFVIRSANDAYDNSSVVLTAKRETGSYTIDSVSIPVGNVGIKTTTPTSDLSFGGGSARVIALERHTTANTAGNSLTIQAGGATIAATSKAGGNLILNSGVSTGTGSSSIQFYTYPASTAGTSDNSPLLGLTLQSAGGLLIAKTIGINGATVSTVRGINTQLYVNDNAGYGINNALTLSGTLTAARVNYAQYNTLANQGDITNFGSTVYGTRSQITNYDGFAYTTGFAAYNYILNNDTTKTCTTSTATYSYILNSSTGSLTNTYGSQSLITNASGGHIGTARGYSSAVRNDEGTITTAVGVYGLVTQAVVSGTISEAYGGQFSIIQTAGTITTGYGVYIGDIGATTAYGIYQEGPTNLNYFAGNVVIGNTALQKFTQADASPFVPYYPGLQNFAGKGSIATTLLEDSVEGAFLYLGKSRSSVLGAYRILSDGDEIGTISFQGDDGAELIGGAYIRALVKGTPSLYEMPTDLIIGLASSGGGLAERFRFTNSNYFGIGTDSPSNHISLGGDESRRIGVERYSSLNHAGVELAISAGGATLTATDKDGGLLILSSGVSTGTGGSSIVFNTATPAISTGNGDNNPTTKVTILGNGNVGFMTTLPTNTISLGGNVVRTIWMERHTTTNTAGNSLTIQAGGSTSLATDKSGGQLILIPGTSTGTGESGVTIQGCIAGSTGTGDGTFQDMVKVLGNKLGFFNATPIVKPSAYTQTYATASKTVPAATASNPPAGGTGATAGAYDTAAHRDAMITSLTNNIADVLALKKVVNALIDDLQALGLIT